MGNFHEVVRLQDIFESLKNFKLLEHKHIIYHFEVGDLEDAKYINLFREKVKFRGFSKSF